MRTTIAFLTDPLVHILLVAACLVALTAYRAIENPAFDFAFLEDKGEATLSVRHEVVSFAGKPRARFDEREASR